MKNTKRAATIKSVRNMKKGIQKFLTCSCVVKKKKSTKNMMIKKASVSQNTKFYIDLNSASINIMPK